ncbi:MAG: anti-repressor SinI family protein [Gorillibacterium sp.]|nr:anti-repressor SinI family protein [Gorillibacterium sp.]
MILSTIKQSEELDGEWLELITQAFELGISSKEIKEFFKVTCSKEKYAIMPPTYSKDNRTVGRSISH